FNLYIDRIRRDYRTNLSEQQYQNSNRNDLRVTIERGIPSMVDFTKTFNKRKVSIKGPTGGYQTVSASTDDIYYPSGSSDNMYAAYADITSFVQQNGLGNYTVADIALREGDGQSVGYYGGWAMVVVYENSKMNWRDVTIFDGFAYIKSLSNNYDTYYELPVSGFHAAQNGAVNVRLGMIAGEGDRSISGDFFKIRNSADTEWESLSHDYNSTNNFFNSSINTGGGLRIPNHENNTGLVIAMFDLDNTNNELIDNNDTATKFQF